VKITNGDITCVMFVGMGDQNGVAFRAAALGALGLGLLLLASSWDGFYEALDLPQAKPALFPQIGGAALVALAYVLWSAPGTVELRRVAATAGVFTHGLGALIIAAWLIFRGTDDLDLDTLGTVLMIAGAVVMAALAAWLAKETRERGRPVTASRETAAPPAETGPR